MSPKSKEKIIKILMIEDDEALCESWLDLFNLIGHELICHRKGVDALKDVNTMLTADLLISDFYLPDINGVDLIKKIREFNPGLKAILLTGSRETSVVSAAQKLDNCSILHKPVNIDEIEGYIEKLFAMTA